MPRRLSSPGSRQPITQIKRVRAPRIIIDCGFIYEVDSISPAARDWRERVRRVPGRPIASLGRSPVKNDEGDARAEDQDGMRANACESADNLRIYVRGIMSARPFNHGTTPRRAAVRLYFLRIPRVTGGAHSRKRDKE